ncbi:MAG: amidohydrolase family protein, partial [Achromobacter mucicolens]
MPSPLPGAAVDTHAHVFHQGLALADTRRHTPDYDATLAEYLGLLDAHGLRHGVLVQPSFLGTDNSHLVQALRAAPARLRGVAVVALDITDTELQDLAGAGVVGIRLNLVGLDSPALQTPAWQSLLARVNALGWHVEIHLQAARLDGVMPALLAADCRIVVDHFGRPDPALGVSDPGFQYLLRQAVSGRVWVKLAAPYRNWGAAACAASGRLATQQLLD